MGDFESDSGDPSSSSGHDQPTNPHVHRRQVGFKERKGLLRSVGTERARFGARRHGRLSLSESFGAPTNKHLINQISWVVVRINLDPSASQVGFVWFGLAWFGCHHVCVLEGTTKCELEEFGLDRDRRSTLIQLVELDKERADSTIGGKRHQLSSGMCKDD